MRGFIYRIFLTCINIFFPPLAVMMLTGMGYDTMVNCCLFLLAVIPSHVHGFYISCTYFHRRHKVKKGRYPGGPKSFIESTKVLNGGASTAQVNMLWRKENGIVEVEQSGRRQGSMRRNNSYRPEMAQRQPSNQIRQWNSNTSRPGVVQRQNSNMRRVATNNSSPQPTARPAPGGYRSRMREHMSRDVSGMVGDPSVGGQQSAQAFRGNPRW